MYISIMFLSISATYTGQNIYLYCGRLLFIWKYRSLTVPPIVNKVINELFFVKRFLQIIIMFIMMKLFLLSHIFDQ